MANANQEKSTQKPANWQAKPAMETKLPGFIMKFANLFVKRLLGGKMGARIMLFTFAGRKSGKKFSIPLGFTREGNTLICFTDSPWQKNLVGGAPVTVTIKGKEIEGFATPVDDQEQLIRYVKGYLQKGGSNAYREMGMSLPKGYIPTDDELTVILRDRMLFKIELQGSK